MSGVRLKVSGTTKVAEIAAFGIRGAAPEKRGQAKAYRPNFSQCHRRIKIKRTMGLNHEHLKLG